jgi:arylsulfate sulfotransferase
MLAAPATRRFSMLPVSGADGAQVPLGTAIQWTADPDNSGVGTFWYRYRVQTPAGNLHLIRDFGPDPELTWSTIEGEGFYQMELTTRNLDTGETSVTTANVLFTPLAKDTPVLTRTVHPLVMIYSAPPCPAGSTITVNYAGPSGVTEQTHKKTCEDGSTMNFYVAGLRQESMYQMWHVISTPGAPQQASTPIPIFSGLAIPPFTGYTVRIPNGKPVSPVLLQSALLEPIVATDLDGNVIWYYSGTLSFLTRPEGDGRFLGIYESGTADPGHQLFREFDLAGNTLLETNAARVNEQLAALGQQPIGGFHHEARALPDGNIVVLASNERILTDVQGPGDVDVIGDTILVLNRNLEVVWSWNAFDHLDPARGAILDEKCTPVGAGCAPFYLAPVSNDWLHGNAVQLTSDGNLLYSARHQDWVIKIDYENGAGNGQILWKLGKDGDFQYASDDPYPWFSHQHDPNFDLTDPTMLYVFDNGNTRAYADPSAHSRGQALHIDEDARTASIVLNADLGDFSMAVGSAAKLSNGNYHFDLGFILSDTGPTSANVEVDPSGKIIYEIQAHTPLYRTFRLTSLYAPENN